MTKTKKTIIISIITIVVIGMVTGGLFLTVFKPSNEPPITPTNTSSENPTSQPTSSADIVVVPDIEPTSSKEPVSSAPTEIKVEGDPTSKPETKPVENTSSTAVTQPTTPTKPTGDGDVYDPRTGTYPKIGDTMTSPKTGTTLVWVAEKPSGGPGWMTTETSGKSGDGQSALDQAHDEGYTGKDIGAD